MTFVEDENGIAGVSSSGLFPSLRKLSLLNHGMATQISEEPQAASELTQSFLEIASSISLGGLNLTYSQLKTLSLKELAITGNYSQHLLLGKDIVVTGKSFPSCCTATAVGSFSANQPSQDCIHAVISVP